MFKKKLRTELAVERPKEYCKVCQKPFSIRIGNAPLCERHSPLMKSCQKCRKPITFGQILKQEGYEANYGEHKSYFAHKQCHKTNPEEGKNIRKVKFEVGRDNMPIAHVGTKVVLPDKFAEIQPKPDEIWEVELIDKTRYFIAKLIKKSQFNTRYSCGHEREFVKKEKSSGGLGALFDTPDDVDESQGKYQDDIRNYPCPKCAWVGYINKDTNLLADRNDLLSIRLYMNQRHDTNIHQVLMMKKLGDKLERITDIVHEEMSGLGTLFGAEGSIRRVDVYIAKPKWLLASGITVSSISMMNNHYFISEKSLPDLKKHLDDQFLMVFDAHGKFRVVKIFKETPKPVVSDDDIFVLSGFRGKSGYTRKDQIELVKTPICSKCGKDSKEINFIGRPDSMLNILDAHWVIQNSKRLQQKIKIMAPHVTMYSGVIYACPDCYSQDLGKLIIFFRYAIVQPNLQMLMEMDYIEDFRNVLAARI